MRLNEKQKKYIKEKKYTKLNPSQKAKVILEFKRIIDEESNFSDELGIKIKKPTKNIGTGEK